MKKIPQLLFFTSLLFLCFFGCTDEFAVQSDPISVEEEALVRQAVWEAQFNGHQLITPDHLQISFFGAYDGVYVFYWEGMTEEYLPGEEVARKAFNYGTVVRFEKVGGTEFRYFTLRPLKVFFEGRILTLSQAYEEGLLNRAELKQIAESHAGKFPVAYAAGWDQNALSPAAVAEVEEAFLDLDRLSLPLDSDIYRYLGTFSGCEVFAIFGNLAEVTNITVGSETFTYHNAMGIYVCEEGTLIPLETYYDEGKISDQEVSLMAERYRTDWGKRADWTAVTFDGLTEEELQPYFDGILSFVEEYYRAEHSTDAIFSGTALPQTEQTKNYLNKKLEYERIFGEVLGDTTIYVDGSFQIADWKSFGDTLVCKVAVALRTRYSDTGTGSYSGWEVQIALQNPTNPHVSDWHIDDVKGNPFETQVRGKGVDLFDSENWLSHADQTALDQRIEDALRDQRESAENLRRLREESLGS